MSSPHALTAGVSDRSWDFRNDCVVTRKLVFKPRLSEEGQE
jgi:hypothetical protein